MVILSVCTSTYILYNNLKTTGLELVRAVGKEAHIAYLKDSVINYFSTSQSSYQVSAMRSIECTI